MRIKEGQHPVVLAIDPATRGFGFAVLAGPRSLLDWGVMSVRVNKHRRGLDKFAELVRLYRPDVVVLEHPTGHGSRRCPRVQRFIHDAAKQAIVCGLPVKHFSRGQIRSLFGRFGALTKEEIADAITDWFPVLLSTRPPRRKCYRSEDPRMDVFDAVSLAIAFYFFEDERYGDLAR